MRQTLTEQYVQTSCLIERQCYLYHVLSFPLQLLHISSHCPYIIPQVGAYVNPRTTLHCASYNQADFVPTQDARVDSMCYHARVLGRTHPCAIPREQTAISCWFDTCWII